MASSPDFSKAYWFATGQTASTRHGFLLLGVRYYAPEYGRFLTWDPIGVRGYGYCENMPTVTSDPSGQLSLYKLNCCLKKAGLGALAGCLLGVGGDCYLCIVAALITCGSFYPGCSLALQVCSLSCGGAVVRCLAGAIAGAIAALAVCLLDDRQCIEPTGPPRLDCFEKCAGIPRGRKHMECMYACHDENRRRELLQGAL